MEGCSVGNQDLQYPCKNWHGNHGPKTGLQDKTILFHGVEGSWYIMMHIISYTRTLKDLKLESLDL